MSARTSLLLAAALSTAVQARAQVPLAPGARVAVDASGDPSIGPAAAPVTVVVFCHYQCGFCADLSGSLRRLSGDFGESVRVVFRDFPLDKYPDAGRAAEAASCANEQDRFMAMNDLLYANRGDLSDPALRRYAASLKLDVGRFMGCLNSGRFEAEWKTDREEGAGYGVVATPTFFVNGLLVEGLIPYADIAALVQQELGSQGAYGAR